MSSYLLDTHVLLWWLDGAAKLSKAARSAIEDEENMVYVSAAVSWEIAIKRAQGKLDFQDDVMQRLHEQTFLPLSITHEHAKAVEALPLIHQDPFDRIQIAQAIIEGLTLITRDKFILQYQEVKTLKV